MSQGSEDDDSLGDIMSEYNDLYFADARDSFDSVEEEFVDEEERLTKQLDMELNNLNEVFLDDFKSKSFLIEKIKRLENFEFKPENRNVLKELAIQRYGLINNKFRKKAWKLLIFDEIENDTDQFLNDNDQHIIKSHQYYNQIKLDVVRTLKRFPPEISDALRSKLQDQLINTICKILIKNDSLHYYQGYHDICLTFLLVVGIKETIPLVGTLNHTHYKFYMEKTMEKTLHLLQNIMPLIDILNNGVAEHIYRGELNVIFALSWLITWYSHVLDDLTIILRLYDFFIATDPLMPVYLAAIIVCERADEVLAVECDMAMLHSFLGKFASQIKTIDELELLIEKSIALYKKYPSEKLPMLSEHWKIKCKKIEQVKLEEERERMEQDNLLRQRRAGKNSGNENRSQNSEHATSNKIVRRKSSSRKLLNKFVMGFVTISVAAAAVYALKDHRDPEDLIMKFYNFVSLKDF